MCVCGIEGVVGWRGGRLRPLRQQPFADNGAGFGAAARCYLQTRPLTSDGMVTARMGARSPDLPENVAALCFGSRLGRVVGSVRWKSVKLPPSPHVTQVFRF